MKTRFFLPIIFSIPTTLSWLALVYRLASGNTLPFFMMWIVVLSFVALTASIAMNFVKAGAPEWRYAAIFNGIPFGLLMLISLFFWLIGYHG